VKLRFPSLGLNAWIINLIFHSQRQIVARYEKKLTCKEIKSFVGTTIFNNLNQTLLRASQNYPSVKVSYSVVSNNQNATHQTLKGTLWLADIVRTVEHLLRIYVLGVVLLCACMRDREMPRILQADLSSYLK
jgi:hypothetical protein